MPDYVTTITAACDPCGQCSGGGGSTSTSTSGGLTSHSSSGGGITTIICGGDCCFSLGSSVSATTTVTDLISGGDPVNTALPWRIAAIEAYNAYNADLVPNVTGRTFFPSYGWGSSAGSGESFVVGDGALWYADSGWQSTPYSFVMTYLGTDYTVTIETRVVIEAYRECHIISNTPHWGYAKDVYVRLTGGPGGTAVGRAIISDATGSAISPSNTHCCGDTLGTLITYESEEDYPVIYISGPSSVTVTVNNNAVCVTTLSGGVPICTEACSGGEIC